MANPGEIEIVSGWFCSECQEPSVELGGATYECSNCGREFHESESDTALFEGKWRECPDCRQGVFARRVSVTSCAKCGATEDELRETDLFRCGTPLLGWFCWRCEERSAEQAARPAYECGNCGEEFNRDAGTTGRQRCPECGRVARRVSLTSCANCGAVADALEQQELFRCPVDYCEETWHEKGDLADCPQLEGAMEMADMIRVDPIVVDG